MECVSRLTVHTAERLGAQGLAGHCGVPERDLKGGLPLVIPRLGWGQNGGQTGPLPLAVPEARGPGVRRGVGPDPGGRGVKASCRGRHLG